MATHPDKSAHGGTLPRALETFYSQPKECYVGLILLMCRAISLLSVLIHLWQDVHLLLEFLQSWEEYQ